MILRLAIFPSARRAGGGPMHQTPQAREFMQGITGLWDSWEDGAFLDDQESGRFFDPEKLHILGHSGEHFSVQGPLNVARPPQGHPVIVQAGSSPDGQDFAARWAEVVFTVQQTLDQGPARAAVAVLSVPSGAAAAAAAESAMYAASAAGVGFSKATVGGSGTPTARAGLLRSSTAVSESKPISRKGRPAAAPPYIDYQNCKISQFITCYRGCARR
ncbi:LLM class flavin-dependent oxidoreductase [Streptomyces marianii]|uniref:LLM class flavin-dependent oxidoreductase n=1 Tax=Streptomyces marianii TaxID=1817406 RepID=A0A5R9E2R0_9ACTN|nr:LLM class flavin-dependent oxidoreductase [Streptomyces marianii]